MDCKKRRKVLFFLPSNTGGAERMTITIAKMLPSDKYEVKFVIVQSSLGSIINFIPKEYDIIHIPIHNIYCAATFRMWNVIHKEKPDVVFSSLLHLNVRLIIAAKLNRIKVIVRNNIDLSRTKSTFNVFLVKKTYRWADKVVAQQEEMRDEIIKYTQISSDKVYTLHNPIDIDSIKNKCNEVNPFPNADQIKYLWVGRFSESKGQDLVVKAFEIVRKSLTNAHLYLVGKYDLNKHFDKSVMEYVENHDLLDYVHFVGFDSNPYKWMKNCDCYVMPSRSEGLPNSLIEAMYLKKPVVATKCIPIISRIVKDSYNGILVESESVSSISSGMIKALSLNDFEMTYKPTSEENILELFEE